MKPALIATAFTMAVSSFTFAADRGGRDGAKNDGDRTGSIERNRDEFDYEDKERCRKHEFGGPLCGEKGVQTK